MLEWLAEVVAGSGPVRVAVDGPDAAGKSTLADALAERLRRDGRSVDRISGDDFATPAERRYARGRYSPEGCYQDGHDYEALRAHLLDSGAAVVLCDGVFLLRPELAAVWDLAVYLRVTPETTLARARLRDAGLMGGPDEVERRYLQRYLPAQEIYRRADPVSLADVVIDNDDPERPIVRYLTPGAPAGTRGGSPPRRRRRARARPAPRS